MKKRHWLLYHWIMGGIVLSSATLLISSLLYIRPTALSDTLALAKRIHAQIHQTYCNQVARRRESLPTDSIILSESLPREGAGNGGQEGSHLPDPPCIPADTEMTGDDNLEMELTEDTCGGVYSYTLNTSMGPMIYYNQHDIRWADYPYGGKDPLYLYGCGPTVVSMLINSFSPTGITPVEAADWAADNGYYAPSQGSYHSLIDGALTAHGLKVQSVKERSPEHAAELLDEGKVLIALMGEGSFTDNGHFILITELLGNGNVHIADPNSYENSTMEWELKQLIAELKHSSDSGAPLWVVSLP